eukprot:6023300-Amphidinium_carterae.1
MSWTFNQLIDTVHLHACITFSKPKSRHSCLASADFDFVSWTSGQEGPSLLFANVLSSKDGAFCPPPFR